MAFDHQKRVNRHDLNLTKGGINPYTMGAVAAVVIVTPLYGSTGPRTSQMPRSGRAPLELRRQVTTLVVRGIRIGPKADVLTCAFVMPRLL